MWYPHHERWARAAVRQALIGGMNSHHLHGCQINTFPPLGCEKMCPARSRDPSPAHKQHLPAATDGMDPPSPGALPLLPWRGQSQVKGGTTRLHQGCGEGVGAERDKRNGRAWPQAWNPPLPGDSVKTPIDGISSITEREGSPGPAPRAAPPNGSDRTAPSPPAPDPGRVWLPQVSGMNPLRLLPRAKPAAPSPSFRKRWEIMSWSTRCPRASFPRG